MSILTLYVCDYCAREARSDPNGKPPTRPWVTIRSAVAAGVGAYGAPPYVRSLDFCSPRCQREGTAPEAPEAHVVGAALGLEK